MCGEHPPLAFVPFLERRGVGAGGGGVESTVLGGAELGCRVLVSLAAAGALVQGCRLQDVAPAEPHSLANLGHGCLVLGQVSPGQDRVQVGPLQSPVIPTVVMSVSHIQNNRYATLSIINITLYGK